MVMMSDALAELLADPATEDVTLGETRARLGSLIAHVGAGGTVAVRDARTDCVVALIVAPPGVPETMPAVKVYQVREAIKHFSEMTAHVRGGGLARVIDQMRFDELWVSAEPPPGVVKDQTLACARRRKSELERRKMFRTLARQGRQPSAPKPPGPPVVDPVALGAAG